MSKVAARPYHVEIIPDINCPSGYRTNVFNIEDDKSTTSQTTTIHRVAARNKDEALAKVIVALTILAEKNQPPWYLYYCRIR